jgi:hypothetical protein
VKVFTFGSDISLHSGNRLPHIPSVTYDSYIPSILRKLVPTEVHLKHTLVDTLGVSEDEIEFGT